MSNVVELLPNNALCVDQHSMAERMRDLAARIEAGEFGDLDRVVVIMDCPMGELSYRCYGRATQNVELVGLLEWLKAKIMGAIG